MGGGGHIPYPKEVWSPAGGWYSDPKYWRRNTALAALSIALICVPLFRLSISKEKHMTPPVRWIPSMMWDPKVPQPRPDSIGGAP